MPAEELLSQVRVLGVVFSLDPLNDIADVTALQEAFTNWEATTGCPTTGIAIADRSTSAPAVFPSGEGSSGGFSCRFAGAGRD